MSVKRTTCVLTAWPASMSRELMSVAVKKEILNVLQVEMPKCILFPVKTWISSFSSSISNLILIHGILISGCIENDTVHQLGSKWMSEDCHVCTCVSPGTTSCVSDTSEFCSQHCSLKSGISSSTTTGGGHQCCSNCNNLNATLRYESHTKLKSCRHQVYSEIEYQSGKYAFSNGWTVPK